LHFAGKYYSGSYDDRDNYIHFSFLGVKIGNLFGVKFQSKAEIVGGLILIGMGCKILFDHLGVISFVFDSLNKFN